jgi:hypothetical protein
LLLLLCQVCVSAQNWQSVNGNYASSALGIRYLRADTTNNVLMCSAHLGATQRLLQFDGTTWDTLGDRKGGLYQVINYLGEYYSVSCFATTPVNSVGKLNGTQWQPFASTSQTAFALYQHDSDLYAMGTFDSIDGIAANQVARYDGTSWSAIGTATFGGGSAVNGAIHYQGDLYIGGGFHDTVGNCLAKWDGQNWTGFGNFFGGGIDAVNCMTVYNGQLYVGGYFTIASGSPGNFIARYDGTTWTQVGGGLGGGQLLDMDVYNGELWVCGQITSAGGIPVLGIAKYDGLDWCNVGTFDNIVAAMEVYNGELYIGGAFWTVDGDSVTSKVLKWIGGNNSGACGHLSTTIAEQSVAQTVSVFPNPSNYITTFQFTEAAKQNTLIITDNTGREIWRRITNEQIVEFPAYEFANGIYFYSAHNGENQRVQGHLVVSH